MKNILKNVKYFFREKSNIARKVFFLYHFVKTNKYWPNFKNPKTFNEKVNHRKKNPKHELFSICSDKIEAKNWVANKIGEEYIIPNYYVGDSITHEQLKEIIQEKGDCLLKANHNSGPVHLLTKESTDEEIKVAVDRTLEQLKDDYGIRLNEPWYSDIKRGLLVEKRLEPEPGETDIRDYKFHMFKQNDGSYKVVLGVYFDRATFTHASYFDESLNWLPFHGQFPVLKTSIEKPQGFDRMLEAAKKLAEPFSYVRVDFYNLKGAIYFGELTFAHASGNSYFSDNTYDHWMGSLWQGDPSY